MAEGDDNKDVVFVESFEGYETYDGEEVDDEDEVAEENEEPGEDEKTDREGLHARLCE